MKKRISALLLTLLLIVLSMPLTAHAEETEETAAPKTGVTINVYNWGEYISDGTDGTLDVNAEFTRRTGIDVNYTTFSSNEELYAKLASGGANYDIIIPSDYMIAKLISENMLQKLDTKNIPNLQHIDKQFLNPEYDKTGEYSVPYTWGTVGIFYNKTMVNDPVDSWDILWNPKYAGKILMFDNPRDAFGIAQKKLGLSYNSTDPAEWYAAAAALKEQKPLVQAYVMDQIFDKMQNGEAALAPYYAGDAARLVEENDNIGFAIPKEGTNKFVDALCIPTGAQHKAEAEAYINFLCDPEVALANIEYIGYSTPETAVREQLDPSISQNEMYYPPQEILDKSETFTLLPDDTSKMLDNLWVEVKSGGSGDTVTLIIVLSSFLVVYIGIVIYKKVKNKRELH